MRRTYRKPQKRKFRKRKKRLFCRAGMAGILLGILLSFGKSLFPRILPVPILDAKPDISITDYTQAYYGAVNPVSADKVSLENLETENHLAELALTNPDIAEIYSRREAYPEDLLTALANNPELTGFVKGYLTAGQTATGGITSEETAQDFPLFMQWDARWGYVPYGGLNIGVSGCGPTCLSMAIFALTKDETATPDALAAYGMENGYYTKGVGTSWSFMTDAPTAYGVCAMELGLDEEIMKYYLDRGCPIICAMRPGDFTISGHFIMLYGYDQDGFMINDPNSRERSGRRWDFETLRYQIKNLWVYSRS